MLSANSVCCLPSADCCLNVLLQGPCANAKVCCHLWNCTVHITHSSVNVCCIALLSMQKSNDTIHFTLSGKLSFETCLRTHCALRIDNSDLVQSMGILKVLRNTSAHSVIEFLLLLWLCIWRYLEKENSPQETAFYDEGIVMVVPVYYKSYIWSGDMSIGSWKVCLNIPSEMVLIFTVVLISQPFGKAVCIYDICLEESEFFFIRR